MPVRGKRSIWPAAPMKPTGMFKQPQKMDSTADMPHKGLMAKAHAHTRKRSHTPASNQKTPKARNGWK